MRTPRLGSPPRMRGKRQPTAVAAANPRITPADAGKTMDSESRAVIDRDHPRGCGENAEKPVTVSMYSGSPPRMRGKLYRAAGIAEKYRITPADAGKTSQPRGLWRWRRDHPRGCGENLHVGHSLSLHRGSPPRMRGKQNGKKKRTRLRGITPADAGKTWVR